VPPVGAAFYPFFALRSGEVGDAERCALLFGNLKGPRFNNFGGVAQYGSPDVARFFFEFVSPVQLNPCLPQIDQ